MDFIPKDKILEFKLHTLESVRKMINMEKPGQMKEAMNILRDWVQKQDHFKKKDFSDHYYEISIILCKGSIERAKKRLDRMCTIRTLLPQYFGKFNAKTDFNNLFDIVYTFFLPKLKDDHTRVIVVKYYNNPIKPSSFTDYIRYTIIASEYIYAHDYMNTLDIVLDYSDANMEDLLRNMSLVDIRQALSIYGKGYSARIGSIHVISQSKFFDGILTIIKQVLSPKIRYRIKSHKTIEGVYKFIPKSILPKDYGGEEPSLKQLQTEWIEVLSSEDNLEYIREMSEAGTDELRRQREFNEEYAGMPGTFRVLSID